MQKLKLKFLFLSVFFSISLCIFPQSDGFSDNHQKEIEQLEGELKEFKNSQKTIIDNISSDQAEIQSQLQRAISSGNEKKIEELNEKLTKSIKANSSAYVKKMVDSSLESFRSLSTQDLRGQLLSKSEGNFFSKIFSYFPKLLDYIVNVLRDPIAIPQFFTILEKKKRLMIFFGINVFLWLSAFIIKKAHKTKGVGSMTHFKRWLFFVFLRLGLFVGFFHTELSPFVALASNTFS